jgi:hypothetical protein
MLDVALSFLVKSLNTYLVARTGSSFGEAEVSRLVDDGGKWAVKEDKLGLSLVNIEEERILKSHLPESTYVNGRQIVREPDLKLNVSVVFAANFKQYDQGLRYISQVLTYFQSVPSFTQSEYPGLDPRIERLVVELQSLSFEQLNQVWAFIGGKQLPSVFYKLRMIILQDQEPSAIGAPITRINEQVHGR